MGRKGNYYSNKWKPTKLQVITDAKQLAIYTTQIVSNDKTFDPSKDFNNELRHEIVSTAKAIYRKSWSANRLSTKAGETSEQIFRTRLNGQALAINACDDLLALIEEAWTQFHVETRRIEHWGNFVIHVQDMLIAWHKSDVDKYRAMFK